MGIAVQIGGVLQYKLAVYCGVSLPSSLRSEEGTAIQWGGGHCRSHSRSVALRFRQGWGFLNSAQVQLFPTAQYVSAAPQQSEICVKSSVFHAVFDVKFW